MNVDSVTIWVVRILGVMLWLVILGGCAAAVALPHPLGQLPPWHYPAVIGILSRESPYERCLGMSIFSSALLADDAGASKIVAQWVAENCHVD